MKNVLLLEVDLNWLASLRKAFVSKGYNVVTLPGPGMLKDYLRRQIPDLVVVYVEALSDNVRRILKTFKGSAYFSAIPVILIPHTTLALNDLTMPELNKCIPASLNIASLLIKAERLLYTKSVLLNRST